MNEDQMRAFLLDEQWEDSIKDNEFQKFLAEWNTSEYVKGKLNEEIFELGEVINKINNKKPEYQPSLNDLIGETGDFYLRYSIWCLRLLKTEEKLEDFHQKVNDAMAGKMKKLKKAFLEKKYTNGI